MTCQQLLHIVIERISIKCGLKITYKGHIRESDLFTGEMVDLEVLSYMEGWDTVDES